MSLSMIKRPGYGASCFCSACGNFLGGMGGELSLDSTSVSLEWTGKVSSVSSSSSSVIMGEVVLLIFLPKSN